MKIFFFFQNIFPKISPKKPSKSAKNRHAPIEIKISVNLFLTELKKKLTELIHQNSLI
jgi:hypothetical protein